MMHQRRFSPRFYRDQQGATILEFAFVAPVFFLIIFGIIEFGLIMFTQTVVESTTMQASRVAAVGTTGGTGCDRVCHVRRMVTQKTGGLLDASRVVVSAQKVAGNTTVSLPEYCLTDPPTLCPANGKCPNNVPFEDHNNNKNCDGPAALSLGESGDLVEIRVSYPYQLHVPLISNIIAPKGVWMVTSSTIVKNEPF